MNNNSLENQVKQYELQQAKNKMGAPGANNTGTGMTNAVPGYNVTSQAQLKTSEKMQAKEDLNKNTMY